jgi:hypothetical protein
MNSLIYFFSQAWAGRLVWSLVHFLWQGTVIAALFAVARPLAAGKPKARHSMAARIRRLIEPSQPSHMIPGPGAVWVLTALLLLGIGTVAIVGAQESQGRPVRPASPAAAELVPTVDIFVVR